MIIKNGRINSIYFLKKAGNNKMQNSSLKRNKTHTLCGAIRLTRLMYDEVKEKVNRFFLNP